MADAVTGGDGNVAQKEFWSSDFGQKWVTHQQQMDTLFRNVTAELLRRCAVTAGSNVLDIGCGTGETTIAFAQQIGHQGRVTGVDISDTLLTLARRRAAQFSSVRFLEGDAQNFSFEPESHDIVASRFGVMFFSDPVAAFANLASALQPSGRIVFATWAEMRANPWSYLPFSAGTARFGTPAPEPAGTPGQFAFADTAYVTDILQKAGLSNVSADTFDLTLHCTGDASDAATLATTLGPVARMIQAHNGGENDLTAIRHVVADEFTRFETSGAVEVPARINYFEATRAV